MRRMVILLSVLLGCGAVFARSSGIVRRYPLSQSGVVEYARPGTPTACWDFESAVGGTYTDDCAATYALTVNGAPAKTTVGDGTWPYDGGIGGNQGNAWVFDGAADSLSRADDGTFDPAGDFSIQCAVTPQILTGTHTVLGKYITGTNQRSYIVQQEAAGVRVYLSDDGTGDGGALSDILAANVLGLHRPAFITFAYDFITDGTSDGFVYVDNSATASNLNMNGPAYNGTSEFSIGEREVTGNWWNGLIHFCTYYDGIVITEAQHDEAFSRWQGRSSTAGDTVRVTVASAAPPAILMAPAASGTEPFLVDMPANSMSVGSPASGSGGLYGAAAITNLVQRSSFVTWAAGAPTGWTEGITSTGDCAEENTKIAHGGESARCTLADADDAVTLTSACVAVSNTTAYYVSAYIREQSGTGLVDINVIEDNDAGCGSPHTTTAVVDDAGPTSDWVRYGGTVTTQATGDFAQVQISLPAAAAQVLDIDAVQLRAGATPTDAYCGADTDASAVCNHVLSSIGTPMSEAGTWQIEATVRSPIDGAVAAARSIMFVLGTAGNNNRIQPYWASDVFNVSVYDAAGAAKTSGVAAAGNADTDYDIKAQKSAAGVVTACWDGTCDATPATAALTDGITAALYFGGTSAAAQDVWVRDVLFLRRLR